MYLHYLSPLRMIRNNNLFGPIKERNGVGFQCIVGSKEDEQLRLMTLVGLILKDSATVGGMLKKEGLVSIRRPCENWVATLGELSALQVR